MPALVDQLGQSQIEAAAGLRAGLHRDAEAGIAGLRAVDGDDEGILPSRLIVGVGVAVADEDLVLNTDRGQVAGANPDEGVAGNFLRFLLEVDLAISSFVAPPESEPRGKEMALPGIGPDVVCEERGIVPLCEPVAAALLLVCESLRQISGRGNLLVEDGPIANGWADHSEPRLASSDISSSSAEREITDGVAAARCSPVLSNLEASSLPCVVALVRVLVVVFPFAELAAQAELMNGDQDDQEKGNDTEQPELERSVEAKERP